MMFLIRPIRIIMMCLHDFFWVLCVWAGKSHDWLLEREEEIEWQNEDFGEFGESEQ